MPSLKVVNKRLAQTYVFIALRIFTFLKMGSIENGANNESRMNLMNIIVLVTTFVHSSHMNGGICHACLMVAVMQ